MNGRHWDGRAFLGALEAAFSALRGQVEEINALNVFPVPDGDTGSNMVATLQSAVAEARAIDTTAATVGRVASAFSFGALMGARGNSGVILSQFFRGIAEAIDGHREIDGRTLAEGLVRACDSAYAAVGRPVEGTMLTVARDVSVAATDAATRNGGDIEAVLSAAAAAATDSVERTPALLQVLRQAGVVDAGGRGLEVLLHGALGYARGDLAAPAASELRFPSFELLEEEHGFGYETVYVVQPRPSERLGLAEIRDRLEDIGESVVVAGDERAVKVHVHSERPDEVIAFGLSLGTLSNISVENLDSQTRDVRREAERSVRGGMAVGSGAPTADGRSEPATRPSGVGRAVVAVAAGGGLARIFAGLGVSASVVGGQGANPSAGELAEAIHATGADEVIVLPNNANVRLAARQAAELCPDVRVEVVPTRNAAEGIAAALAFRPESELAAAAQGMLRAARGLQTMQVTRAVRDARIGRRTVHEGEHIVLGPDDGLLAADPDRLAAIRAGIARLKPGFELLTVYRGSDVSPDEADELADVLRADLDGVEVEVVDGGQPHYSFLISAE